MTHEPHNNRPVEDLALLDRYLANEATSAERARVEAWLVAEPAWRAALDALRTPANEMTGFVGDVERDLARLRQMTMAHPSGRGRSYSRAFATKRTVQRSIPRTWMLSGVAAAALLVIGVTMTPYLQSYRLALSDARPIQTYVTARGEQLTVTLADGSRVQLAPQSRLAVRAQYGSASRRVMLNGEAYFTVKASAGAPFIVQTGAVSTRVLGTAFGVRRYDADREVRVAVVSGKVVAGGSRKTATLTAGGIGLFTDSTMQVSTGDASAQMSWTEGRLTFEDAPVPVVLATVGRWYGYDFRLADSSLATQHLSVVFKTSAPEETMVTLKRLLDVTMTFDHTVVTLRPRRFGTGAPAPSRRDRDTTLLPFKEVGR